jgi:hypothetical protein
MSMPEVTYQHNGHILCDECATYWCVHVEEVVKKNLDVNFIWEQYPGTQKIAVPIIPTANQWAMVELVEPDVHGVPTYEAWIDSGHSGIPDASLFGFIHESEGRLILRSMVLDWFEGTLAYDIVSCPSRGHGYKQQTMFMRDMKSRKSGTAQKWSIWSTGKCLGCSFDISRNKDLIPEKEPSYNPFS